MQTLERVIFGELARLRSGDGIAGQVQAILADGRPAGKAEFKDATAELAVSPLELRGRLEQAGTSFRAEIDQVRQALARPYLRDPPLSLIEIAFLLGFSDDTGPRDPTP
jgi:AraC-like DNA-binding protein